MKTLFQIDDKTTGDAFEIEHDARGDRLLVHVRLDRAGVRSIVLINAARVGLEISDALRDALDDTATPITKTPRRVAL